MEGLGSRGRLWSQKAWDPGAREPPLIWPPVSSPCVLTAHTLLALSPPGYRESHYPGARPGLLCLPPQLLTFFVWARLASGIPGPRSRGAGFRLPLWDPSQPSEPLILKISPLGETSLRVSTDQGWDGPRVRGSSVPLALDLTRGLGFQEP